MRTTATLCFLLIFGWSFGQTTIISHKSHSGNAEDFAFADPGNYGAPPVIYQNLFRINDTVIAAESVWSGENKILIINNRALQDSLRDTAKVLRLKDYQLDALIGKDTSSKVIYLNHNETPQQRLEQMAKEQNKQQIENKQERPKPHGRKGSLLYFGLIIGASLAFGALRKLLARA